jgi:hypothetical protein
VGRRAASDRGGADRGRPGPPLPVMPDRILFTLAVLGALIWFDHYSIYYRIRAFSAKDPRSARRHLRSQWLYRAGLAFLLASIVPISFFKSRDAGDGLILACFSVLLLFDLIYLVLSEMALRRLPKR